MTIRAAFAKQKTIESISQIQLEMILWWHARCFYGKLNGTQPIDGWHFWQTAQNAAGETTRLAELV